MANRTRKHKQHGIEINQVEFSGILALLGNRVEIQPDECWTWTGAKTPRGYGKVNRNHRFIYVHRLAYETFRGSIPPEMEIDHLCNNRACVRPDHLRAVTHLQNTMRSQNFAAVNAAKTECGNGHPFNEANTYFDKDGWRHCRVCLAMWARQRRARIRRSQEGTEL